MNSIRRLLCLCLFVPSLLRAQAGAESRTALVIGCDYAGTVHRLPSPVKDARAMAAKLEQLGFTVMLRINPDLSEFERVSNEFAGSLKARKGVGLFYFSGHGAQVDDRNYLIPNNATLDFREDLRTRAYAAQDVVTRMEAAGSRLNLLFLDACRTNELPSSTSKSLAGGFAGMDAATGMLISFASARNTVAIDTGFGSAYTNALLDHIATPGLSVLDMLTRVSAQVKRETGGKQIPFMEVGLDGTFAFAPAVTLPPLAAGSSLLTQPSTTVTSPWLSNPSLTGGRLPFSAATPAAGSTPSYFLTPPANSPSLAAILSSYRTQNPTVAVQTPFTRLSQMSNLNSVNGAPAAADVTSSVSSSMAARLFTNPSVPAPAPAISGIRPAVPASEGTTQWNLPWRYDPFNQNNR